MMYMIIGVSLLFVAIGFIVTENNARYLLAGYNTMREEERAKFDIKSYLPFFRRFHLFLGVSLLVLYLVLTSLAGEKAGGIFLVAYPILGYVYFIWNSSRFYGKTAGPG